MKVVELEGYYLSQLANLLICKDEKEFNKMLKQHEKYIQYLFVCEDKALKETAKFFFIDENTIVMVIKNDRKRRNRKRKKKT